MGLQLMGGGGGSTDGLKAEVEIVNLGTDWSTGDSQPIFVGKDAVGSHLNMKVGTEGSPDTHFGPAAKVSRTIAVPESAFSGAGSLGLAAIAGVTRATAASEGQAVGVEGGAVTASTHEGAHSNADAFGGGFTGRSTSGSNRVGGGLYATGQRNHIEGRATGAEISADNNTATPGVYNAGTYSSVTGVWITPKGTVGGGVGVVIGHPEAAKFKVGYALNEGSVTDSSFRDDSESAIGIDIRKPHATAAIKLAESAGTIDLGKNPITNPGSLGNPYRTLARVSGNANTSAAEATKYFLISGQTNAKEVNPQSTAAANLPYLIIIAGADLAGPGTTKLRTSATIVTGTGAPGKDITVGLYPVTGSPTQTLGAVVEGSTAKHATPAKELTLTVKSGDFTPPADGVYALGYIVSGTPAAGFALQASLEYHHV